HELSFEESEKIQQLSQSSQSLLYSAKYITYLIEDWDELQDSDNKFLDLEISSLQDYFSQSVKPILQSWQVDEYLTASLISLEENKIREQRLLNFSKRISQGLIKTSFPENRFSTILNTLRAIYQSFDHLLNAIQNLFPLASNLD